MRRGHRITSDTAAVLYVIVVVGVVVSGSGWSRRRTTAGLVSVIAGARRGRATNRKYHQSTAIYQSQRRRPHDMSALQAARRHRYRYNVSSFLCRALSRRLWVNLAGSRRADWTAGSVNSQRLWSILLRYYYYTIRYSSASLSNSLPEHYIKH